MIESLMKAMLGITMILGVWLWVQWVWIRITGAPTDQDALQGRLGCHGCHCETQCDNQTRQKE